MVQLAHQRAVYFKDWSWRGGLLDGLIDLCSGGNPLFPGHCHTEILFSNGHSFTSTSRSDPETRIFPENKAAGPMLRRIYFRPDLWHFTPLGMSEKQEFDLYDACWHLIRETHMAGGGYDFAGCARFVLPFVRESATDWFCTEACVHVLQPFGYFREQTPHRLSPNKLYSLCASRDMR